MQKNVTGLNWLIQSCHPLLYLGLQQKYAYKQPIKILDRFNSKWPHTITKINDNTNIDSSVNECSG
jgi:hypothetical protein